MSQQPHEWRSAHDGSLLEDVGTVLQNIARAEWPIREEVEASDASWVIARLRAADRRKRFEDGSALKNAQQLMERREEMRRYNGMLQAVEFAVRDKSEIAWDDALRLVRPILPKSILARCCVRRAVAISKQLSQCARSLREVLIEWPECAEAWLARGHVFLEMDVPALAIVHFVQPAIPKGMSQQLQLYCRERLNTHAGLSTVAHRKLLEDISSSELLARAIVLNEERYLNSSLLYSAAALAVPGLTDEQKCECLLQVMKVWRIRDTRQFAAVFKICDLCLQMNATQMSNILFERAACLAALCDYQAAAIDLERIHVDELELERKSEFPRLSTVVHRAVSIGIISKPILPETPTGLHVVSGKYFGSSRINKIHQEYSCFPFPLILVSCAKEDIVADDSMVEIGRFEGLPSEVIDKTRDVPQITVLDFRKSFFFRTVRLNQYIAATPACAILGKDFFLLRPLDVSDRLLPCSDHDLCEHEGLKVSFADVIATLCGLLHVQGPRTGTDLSNAILGKSSARAFIEVPRNCTDTRQREVFIHDTVLEGIPFVSIARLRTCSREQRPAWAFRVLKFIDSSSARVAALTLSLAFLLSFFFGQS